MQYWVYLWACHGADCHDSETLVAEATVVNALVSAMQYRQVTFAIEALVVPAGTSLGQTFCRVSLDELGGVVH